MVIDVYVKFGHRSESVVLDDSGQYQVWVASKPQKGEANSELELKIAEYFKVPKSTVSIIKGFKSRKKRVKIDSNE